MTVKIFVPRDLQGKEWAPDYPHEVDAIIGILRELWKTYHHLESLYCVVPNMKLPSADLVVITERGVGVIEIKHHYGKIHIDPVSEEWRAGTQVIPGGTNARNPHKQVQSYAEQIRRKFLNVALPREIRKRPENFDKIKFQTSVCFTNPNVDISAAKSYADRLSPGKRKPWENNFSVIRPIEVPNWVATLRFGMDLGPETGYQPLRLQPSTIVHVVEFVFGGVEWEEAIRLMPSTAPYAYLELQDGGARQVFNLADDRYTFGRDPSCDIIVPLTYSRVSKSHGKLTRDISTVFIEDTSSTNGTYVDGKRITSRTQLKSGTRIILGGPAPSDKTCCFVFKIPGAERKSAAETEVANTSSESSE